MTFLRTVYDLLTQQGSVLKYYICRFIDMFSVFFLFPV